MGMVVSIMSGKNHKINRRLIKSSKEEAKRLWHRMSFLEKLIVWKLSYKDFERYFAKGRFDSRWWKYGKYK